MDNPYIKLDNFTSVITADAVAESNEVYEQIKRERQAALDNAEDDALTEMFRFIKIEVARINTESGRRVSKKMMEAKRDLAIRRTEMNNEVILKVRKKLSEYVKTTAYLENLKKLLINAMQVFDADAVVSLCANDMPLAAELSKLDLKHKVTFNEGNFQIGGLRAVCPAKKIQIDESMDTTLSELSTHFAEMFGLEVGGKAAQ